MTSQSDDNNGYASRLLSSRPVFTLPSDMRQGYLSRRRGELEALTSSAKGNEWKYVIKLAQHVRGTGRMYGFDNIGDAAEELCKAIQSADPKCMEYVVRYAEAVHEAYV